MADETTDISVTISEYDRFVFAVSDNAPIIANFSYPTPLNVYLNEKTPIDVSIVGAFVGEGIGAIVPQSSIINRTDGDISSIDFANGKTTIINRANGEIESVDDGTYLKTIVRENGEILISATFR
jgi:hypothetical protein